MKDNYKIVGEGTYGCVIKPSLKCNSHANYNNRVSKVMVTKDAKDELEENNNFKNIDGIDKYAISSPLFCKPKLDNTFKKTVKKCTNERVSHMLNYDPSFLSMLLLEDGGMDLTNILKIFKTLKNKEQENFFHSIINLFEGLLFFQKNNIVHRDIKLQNIVYNLKEGTCKFIDFGLASNSNNLKLLYQQGKEKLAVSWYYFPPETSCANKPQFDKSSKCKIYSSNFNYKNFIDKFIKTYDLYCLTFALEPLFYNIGKNVEKYLTFSVKCIYLLRNFNHKSLLARNEKIELLIETYKKILEEENINKTVPLINIEKIPSAEFKYSIKDKECPIDKPILNKNTNRCLKLCKDGYIRNSNYKCVTNKKKTRITKIINKKSKKNKCEDENKDYNPYTKRCNKKCKITQKRDSKFKCVNIK
tara:strand:+ start:36665 stop:37912 length:1248 start_codon:yes stop_codon:yes gene_type:complete